MGVGTGTSAADATRSAATAQTSGSRIRRTPPVGSEVIEERIGRGAPALEPPRRHADKVVSGGAHPTAPLRKVVYPTHARHCQERHRPGDSTDTPMNPRLYISHDTGLDWLMAFEFGRFDDAQPPDCWRGVSERFGFLHDAPGGRVVGFKVVEFSTFDPDDEDSDGIWDEPRFDAPLLALSDASAAAIVVAGSTHFDGRDSLNRRLFGAATNAEGEDAVTAWRQCLESGDAMAHFGLGYTLFELGRHAQAYRHLRHYTEIAPHGAWNWCWYGYAAEAIGEVTEARRAYLRAIELERTGDQETDAAERLERLGPSAGADGGASPPEPDPAGPRVEGAGSE